MKMRARKDVEDAIDTEETEEEEVVVENEDEDEDEEAEEEAEAEETKKAQRSFKHPGGGAKKPPINDKTKQNTTNGPPKNTSGKMKTRKKTEEAQDDDETTDDLDARVASAVERALEDQLSPLLAKMEEFFTGQIAKSEGKRPVSKQANGQDRVTKSDPRNVGEGVFTNIVF